jgi:tetratricopeptide (TPR) repeat protein
MKTFFKTICVCLLTVSIAAAQPGKKPTTAKTLTKDQLSEIKSIAAGYYKDHNYNKALEGYQALVNSDEGNMEYNYRLGMCYLNTNFNKPAAIEYLLKASTKKDCPKDVNYHLGNALMYAGELDDAIENLEKYKEQNQGKLNAKFNVDNHITWCDNAKELMKNPVAVKFTNAGKQVNSVGADYRPVCDAEGSIVYFASNRKGNMGGIADGFGEFITDIYFTTFDTGFSKAKTVGPMVNTEGYDESFYLNANGDKLLLFREGGDVESQIYYSDLNGKSWNKILPLGDVFNFKERIDGACFGPESKTVWFAAELKGTKGGKDIWYSNYDDEKKEWGAPKNAGDEINTKFDEACPMFTADGKNLFFASEGHQSMGGFDIFITDRADESASWSKPTNIGYPINTFYDDKQICVAANGKTGYMAAVRKEGFGDYDIYRFTLGKSLLNNTSVLFKATLQKADGTPAKDALCTITKSDTGESFGGVIKSNALTGKILAALPAGTYKLKVKGIKSGRLDTDFTITGEEKGGKLEKIFKLLPPVKEK